MTTRATHDQATNRVTQRGLTGIAWGVAAAAAFLLSQAGCLDRGAVDGLGDIAEDVRATVETIAQAEQPAGDTSAPRGDQPANGGTTNGNSGATQTDVRDTTGRPDIGTPTRDEPASTEHVARPGDPRGADAIAPAQGQSPGAPGNTRPADVRPVDGGTAPTGNLPAQNGTPPADQPAETGPVGQVPAGPSFPNLRHPCSSGAPDAACLVGLGDLLAGKLLVTETMDASGALYRDYLFLCPARGYAFIRTLVDGVSAPTRIGIVQAFQTQPGERPVFTTVDYYDGDLWEMKAMPNGDAAITFPIGLVDPPSPEFAQLIGQDIDLVLNAGDDGSLYVNGVQATIYYAGDVCFAE